MTGRVDARLEELLQGLVVVLATVGDADAAAAVTTGVAIARSGALLAVVTTDSSVIDGIAGETAPTPPISWRASPTDPDTWTRLLPHIEQRLGPVDGAVADAASLAVLQPLLEPDLRRRGHGAVVPLSSRPDPLTALARFLGRTPQPEPPPAPDVDPDS